MLRLLDILGFTLERIRQHLILVFWVVVGISVATTLALSMSLYVDSVYTDLLQSRLPDPPYAFRFRYLGAWNGNITGQDVENASAAIQDGFVQTIGLPTNDDVRFLRGGTWSLRMENFNLGTFSIGMLEGADEKTTIVEGEWPAENIDDKIPVLLSETMLYRLGLQVGSDITGLRSGGQPVSFYVAALWRPTNANDPAWIFPPKFFDDILILESDTFWALLDGVENPIDEAAWYLNFDGSGVRTSSVSALLGNIVSGQRDVDGVLPGIRADLAPSEELTAFNDEVNQLTLQLFIIIAPVGGLVLYFVSMVAGLLVNRQQAEDVKLRSRGMSRFALLMVHTLMWVLIAGVSLLIGISISPMIVRLVGQTSSFLRFDDPTSVNSVVLTSQSILFGGITGAIAASTGLFLAWRTTRQNINSFRQTAARAGKAWWQRAYLDLLLLIPAIYILYTLQQRGGLVTEANAAFSEPLTFVGPTLFALAMALLFLRLWPMFVGTWARLIAVTRNVALLMALRG